MAAFLAGGMIRRYLFGFGAIALLAVAALVALIDYGQTVDVRASQIEQGGRLRADVQGAALAAQEAVLYGEGAAAGTARSPLQVRIEALREAYAALMDRDGVQHRTLSAAALALFFEPPLQIDERFSRYLERLDALAAGPDDASQAVLLVDILGEARVLDDAFAAFVGQVTDEHAGANFRLLTLVGGALAAIVLLVVAGVFVVVRPALRTSSRAEERIADSQAQVEYARNQLASAFEAMREGVALFDASGRLVFSNEAFRAVYQADDAPILRGTRYEAFIRDIAARGLIAGVGDDDDIWIQEQLDRHQHDGQTAFRFTDGRSFDLVQRKTGDGGTVLVQSDATEMDRRDAARKTTERRARSMIDAVFDGVITIDPGGVIETMNARAEEIFGHSAADALGKSMAIFLVDDDLAAFVRAGDGAIQEVRGRRHDGTQFPLEVAVNKLEDTWSLHDRRSSARRVFIATLRDISRSKELSAQLQQAQKMEAIGTLAGGIAHDFNNILSIILGYASLLEDEVEDAGETRENLDMVVRAARRARDLVEQILTFSRRSERERRPLDPKPVFAEALKLLRSTLPATIEIRTHIDEAPMQLLADPSQLHQVLMNLCTNAAHAMSESGGILEVSIERARSAPAGDSLRLSVADTGAGMDADTAGRIFEPFFTTKERGQGTGLGLAVVHGIITEHGGTIDVASRPGEGATFTAYLPIDAAVETAAEEPAPTAPPRGRGRILFVDDEVPIVRMGQKILGRLGYTVVGATESEEALDAFREAPAAFDLVITDQTMPVLTGDALIAEVRKLRPDIPVILCTGYSQKMNEDTAKAAGIDAFLMKPLEAGELGWAVARALNVKA